MNITNIIYAVALLGALGLLFGIILSLASIFFHVQQDERVGQITEILPGANCGACGFAGCEAYAKAVVEGVANPGGCAPGGEKAASAISEIIGKDVEFTKRVARIKCAGRCNSAPLRYDFSGLEDCRAAARIGGGPKACNYGCIGLGSCIHACPINALSVKDGIVVVDESKCMACGLCVAACPKDLIELVPTCSHYFVYCASRYKGAEMKELCEIGCIGCKICQKNCPEDAIEIENNLAKINPDKCKNCGICAEKCPKKIIKKY